MADLAHLYRESLTSRLRALEAARSALEADEPDAPISVRRIAHTLRGSGTIFGFPEITEHATRVEEAGDDALGEVLDGLIVTVRAVIDSPGTAESILVVEEDGDLAENLETALADRGHPVHRAGSLAEARELLDSQRFDLVFLGLVLPDGDGRDLLSWLRTDPQRLGLPVLLLGPRGSARLAPECLALGADDFFETPVDIDALVGTAEARLRRIRDQARRSERDPLTGLPNRAGLARAFEQGKALADRTQSAFSLALVDLDHFKVVNDTYGHAVGDRALRRTADVLQETLRKTDTVGRWGGEEFLVLFGGTDPEGAARALDKVLAELRTTAIPGFDDDESVHLTFSAGVVGVNPRSELEDAVAEADRLLYRAKAAGRNRVLRTGEEVGTASHRVLLAEDDGTLAALLAGDLEDAGLEVLWAPDGESALEIANKAEVDLVLLDVQMPVLGGFEVLSRLRAEPTFRRVPIVMITSAGAEGDVVRAFDLGADDYVLKPVAFPALLARLRRLLRG